MDNMINLELLFWAAQNGGSPLLRDIAISIVYADYYYLEALLRLRALQ